jgi:hypothetical protein
MFRHPNRPAPPRHPHLSINRGQNAKPKHGLMASGLGLADGRWTVPQLLALADAVAEIRETP